MKPATIALASLVALIILIAMNRNKVASKEKYKVARNYAQSSMSSNFLKNFKLW